MFESGVGCNDIEKILGMKNKMKVRKKKAKFRSSLSFFFKKIVTILLLFRWKMNKKGEILGNKKMNLKKKNPKF